MCARRGRQRQGKAEAHGLVGRGTSRLLSYFCLRTREELTRSRCCYTVLVCLASTVLVCLASTVLVCLAIKSRRPTTPTTRSDLVSAAAVQLAPDSGHPTTRSGLAATNCCCVPRSLTTDHTLGPRSRGCCVPRSLLGTTYCKCRSRQGSVARALGLQCHEVWQITT